MELLLTILSVLAAWAFLTVLIVGLLLIFKTLDGVKGYLERIAMGVRAIERETDPLEQYASGLETSLRRTGEQVGGAARRMNAVERGADAVKTLQHRS